ncbi:MAG: GDSL-type esterase/lipase family protein [Acidobacteriota bacterium]|nr:GDSL-type esterase/lipase family protein [Acidobacteriota bacterium]
MRLFVGSQSRVPGFSRKRKLIRLNVFVPALVVAVLFSVHWCTPDGIPPQPIDSFVLALHSLETQRAGKFRVLHFGDSHIASDNESSIVRSSLQNRFGDGGAGLVLPWGGPRLSTINFTYGGTYGWQRSHPSYNSPIEDTGLSLSYIEAESPNQRVWIEARGGEFRVDYLAQPGGGDAEFLLDGMSLGRRKMGASFPQVETARFQAPGPDAPHRFEIRTLDFGRIRLLGVSVEKAAPGVVYSALGLVGARAEYLLKCREESFEAQIAAEQPDLVILGYGTNETSGSYLDQNSYETALISIISRIRRAAPSVLIILLTPPDRSDSRSGPALRIHRILQEVIAAQRDVARRDGAILMDLHTAMGGTGAAERWATTSPPLARSDMTHFTNEGYDLLGRYIAGGIMKLYDAGADTTGLPSNVLEANGHPGELLPPLYPVSTGGTRPSAGPWEESDSSSTAAQIFYFLKTDGQVVVTNDLATIDSTQGKVITAQQARCVLRGKATPCDNTGRW